MKFVGYSWIGKRGEFTIKKKTREIMGMKPEIMSLLATTRRKMLLLSGRLHQEI